MSYYHVIAKVGSEDKFRLLFADIQERELRKSFVKPYERGVPFFSGNELVPSLDLRLVKIIRTTHEGTVERDEINRKSRKQIDEINRTSSSLFFVSAGGGYEPEDIAEAGVDVTHDFLNGPPGFRNARFWRWDNVASWIVVIVTSLIVAGLAKLLGLD